MPAYVVCTIKSWNIKNFQLLKNKDTKNEWHLITRKEDLTYPVLKRINPVYVFFPHWSWKIPEEIYNNFVCIGFHMTDLPFGRGGSPLQNLIVRGIYETKVSAFRVTKEMDAGDIYLKRDLNLDGAAKEIFERMSSIVYEMILEIVNKKIVPRPQQGEVVLFKRRTPAESDISSLNNIQKIYDYIRMLDAEGYPPAFIETQHLRIEFSDAQLKNNTIIAKCTIQLKDKK